MNSDPLQQERYVEATLRHALPELRGAYFEIKAFAPLRLAPLRGAMADFILRRQHGEISPETVLVVLVPSCTKRVVRAMNSYAARYAPDLRWGILDAAGRGRIATGGGEIQRIELPPLRATHGETPPNSVKGMGDVAPSKTVSGNLFTPNNQWLLKVLLLSGIGERYWGGPVVARNFGVGQLAEAAGVPQPSVSRFVAMAETKGFILRSGRAVAMRRLPLLLDQWTFYLRNNPDTSVPASPMYGDIAIENSVEFDGKTIVAGGEAAIQTLKLSISNAGRPVLYVRNVESVLDEYELEHCSGEEAVCELRKPRAERAVFDGCAAVADRHVADILQLYLDARLSAARGEEQAEYIFDTVLAPHFREKQWH